MFASAMFFMKLHIKPNKVELKIGYHSFSWGSKYVIGINCTAQQVHTSLDTTTTKDDMAML